jgi:transposase-like protein
MTGEAVNAASMAFKKALIERALGAELSHHLGYPAGGAKPDDAVNHRNGASGKTVRTDDGPLHIEVPRDRDGSFEPVLIAKHERRFTGFDDKIIAMYARGMTMREVQGFLAETYGVEVSPEFISSVTDAVMAEVSAWQARPSSRCTRWSSSTRCGSRSAKTPSCATRRSISRSACCPTAGATSWACGSRAPKGPSSG